MLGQMPTDVRPGHLLLVHAHHRLLFQSQGLEIPWILYVGITNSLLFADLSLLLLWFQWNTVSRKTTASRSYHSNLVMAVPQLDQSFGSHIVLTTVMGGLQLINSLLKLLATSTTPGTITTAPHFQNDQKTSRILLSLTFQSTPTYLSHSPSH